MNIDLSSPSFDTKYSIYETSFREKQDRSRKFYETVDKVATAATFIGGIAGFAGFAVGSRAFYLALSPDPIERVRHIMFLTIISLCTLPIGWAFVGCVMTYAGAAVGYGLTHLTGRIVAHIKKIDYFSPELTDYQFAQQNQALKAQRDSLEKLFHAKYYNSGMAVVEKVKTFLEETKPLFAQFPADPEFTKILNLTKDIASFSQERFYQHLHSMSNAQLKDNYHTFDASIQQLERQFEQAKDQMKALLNRKISVINSFSTQAAA